MLPLQHLPAVPSLFAPSIEGFARALSSMSSELKPPVPMDFWRAIARFPDTQSNTLCRVRLKALLSAKRLHWAAERWFLENTLLVQSLTMIYLFANWFMITIVDLEPQLV